MRSIETGEVIYQEAMLVLSMLLYQERIDVHINCVDNGRDSHTLCGESRIYTRWSLLMLVWLIWMLAEFASSSI